MGHLTMEWDSSLLRYWGVKIYADFFNGLSPQQRENAILHKPLNYYFFGQKMLFPFLVKLAFKAQEQKELKL